MKELRRWVAKHGLTKVAAEIGTSKESVARFAAGMPIRAGTRLLIEQALKNHYTEKMPA